MENNIALCQLLTTGCLSYWLHCDDTSTQQQIHPLTINRLSIEVRGGAGANPS